MTVIAHLDVYLIFSELVFERAYCLYRLNRVNEAKTLLKEVSNPSFRVQELLAQVVRYYPCFYLILCGLCYNYY